jgi:uncharacterized protein YukE
MTDLDERQLQSALNALPRDIAPVRDLWPGIAQALHEDVYAAKPPHRSRYLALAASLLLILASSLYYGQRQAEPSREGGELEALISSLQSHHQSSKNALLVQYQGQSAAYTDWQARMRELEAAEDAIYDALRQDPNNLALLHILRQVQDKQIMLIDAVFSPRIDAI